MYTVIVFLYAISVVDMVFVGVLPATRRRDAKDGKRLSRLGWSMLIGGALVFVVTTLLMHNETKKADDKLYAAINERVMEGPREDSPPPTPPASEEIHITSPPDGSRVPQRPRLEGTVSNPESNVWVVVHPVEVSSYWVQPAVNVKDDGSWRTQVYLGRGGEIDVGKHFEIIAIANPKTKLIEGHVLGGWPEAELSSRVIEVIRR